MTEHTCNRCKCKCIDDAEGHSVGVYWLCDSCYNEFEDWMVEQMTDKIMCPILTAENLKHALLKSNHHVTINSYEKYVISCRGSKACGMFNQCHNGRGV